MKQFVSRHFERLKHHPNQRLRKAAGMALAIGGLLGFLPVLGFWMLPLGLALLSVDWLWARRADRRLASWWGQKLRGLRLRTRSAAQGRRVARNRETHSDP